MVKSSLDIDAIKSLWVQVCAKVGFFQTCVACRFQVLSTEKHLFSKQEQESAVPSLNLEEPEMKHLCYL